MFLRRPVSYFCAQVLCCARRSSSVNLSNEVGKGRRAKKNKAQKKANRIFVRPVLRQQLYVRRDAMIMMKIKRNYARP